MMSSQGKNKQKSQECFSRMNFMYQASILMAGTNNTLSSYYGELCKNIGKKSVLRLEPKIKRNFCKRCSVAQRSGVTCEVDVQNKKKIKTVAIDENCEVLSSCKLCGHRRKFIINTNYKFWLENSESIEGTVDNK